MSDRNSLERSQIVLGEQPYRPIAPDELRLLEHLLRFGKEPSPKLLAQLPMLEVQSWCPCGCPSIDLRPNDLTPVCETEGKIVVDVFGRTPSGHLVGGMVFVTKGKLSLMEFYDLTGLIEGSWPLPTIESITNVSFPPS